MQIAQKTSSLRAEALDEFLLDILARPVRFAPQFTSMYAQPHLFHQDPPEAIL
jgi:hypothetical protein